jgi:hypothetical protein
MSSLRKVFKWFLVLTAQLKYKKESSYEALSEGREESVAKCLGFIGSQIEDFLSILFSLLAQEAVGLAVKEQALKVLLEMARYHHLNLLSQNQAGELQIAENATLGRIVQFCL